MNTLRISLGILTKILGFVGSALVILLILHVTLDVVMRNVIGYPIAGTIEIVSIVYMIGICFLPLALVDERDAHISVEVLTEMMPARIVNVLIGLGVLLTLVVMVVLCWRTFLEAMAQMRNGSAMIVAGSEPLITWPSYFLLPIGFGFAVLVGAYKLVCVIRRRPFDLIPDDKPAGMELIADEKADR